MATQRKPLIASQRAAELMEKWEGNKEHAIKDVEGSIEMQYDIHHYNREDPPYYIKWLLDVIEEIKKIEQ